MDTRPDPPGWPQWMRDWVLPYIEEELLWPVYAALVGHVVVVFAMALLGTWRGNEKEVFVLVASIVLSIATVAYEWRCTRKLRGVTIGVVVTWVLSVLGAWAADAYEIY